MTFRQVGPVLSLLLIACDSPTAPDLTSTQVPNVTGYVTADVAQLLDSNGRFAGDWACTGASHEMLTPDAAQEWAVYFARRYLAGTERIGGGTAAGVDLSDDHGHEIDWSQVMAVGRPSLCATSPLAPMPSDFPQITLNHYGPYHLVPLYVGSDQVAMVSVAANATLFLGADGALHGRSGGEFRWAASPHAHAFGNPLSPEAAAKIVAERTNALVADLPRFLSPGHNIHAHLARWEIRLDRVVEGTRASDGSRVRSDVIYVGYAPSFVDLVPGEPWSPRLFVAASDQPTEQVVSVIGQDGTAEQVSWPIRAGVPTNFWEVSF